MGYFVCDDNVIIDNKMYCKNTLYYMDICYSDYHYYYDDDYDCRDDGGDNGSGVILD
jgi:hypothetical protein